MVLLHHEKSWKGAALKTGFLYIQQNCVEPAQVVTADADGQLASDMENRSGWTYSKTPTIGVRAFDTKMPFRSKFGNYLTNFFQLYQPNKFLSQTGLRGFIVKINTLLFCVQVVTRVRRLALFYKISKVREIPITTVPEPGNPTSISVLY